MRLLRTVAYWIRYLLRPSSVSWTDRDDHEAEWEFWEADDYRGSEGDAT